MTERAGRPGSSPTLERIHLLQGVSELGWLAPCAASLAALTQPPSTAVWHVLRDDPGAVLLLLRLPAARQADEDQSTALVSLLDEPSLPNDALNHLLAAPSGFVNWQEPGIQPIFNAALTYARVAEQLALHSGRVEPETARICGLLAALGWFAVCAVAPAKALACLADSSLANDTVETQLRHWGADHAALARRLARRWRLPGWIMAVVGHLGLPIAQARAFGADPDLFHVTRLALCLSRGLTVDLGLSKPEWAAESAAALGLTVAAAEKLVPIEIPAAPVVWESPYGQPLLRDVLSLAAENRRLRAAPLQQQLEGELDELQRAFEEQVQGEAQRLQTAKLSALAEFAGGAGHEINNPLAVMSGQAQYLLNHERDWLSGDAEGKATKALHTIIGQTKRVHALLRDLMLFARPAAARKAWFDLPTLLGEVAAGLEELAHQRSVRIEVGRTPEHCACLADADQLRTALSCVLKNALEAAPAEGWARLRIVEPASEHRLEIVVEDSGSGPAHDQRAHLFDPFYSGRPAGRGRGLGLPIAWRLLRLQGGDIHLQTNATGPTCFLIGLPRVQSGVLEPSNHLRNGTAVER